MATLPNNFLSGLKLTLNVVDRDLLLNGSPDDSWAVMHSYGLYLPDISHIQNALMKKTVNDGLRPRISPVAPSLCYKISGRVGPKKC